MTDVIKPLPSLRAVAERLAGARAAVGLAAFIVVFALLIFIVETLSLLGVPDRILVWMIVVFALALPALAAVSARTVSLTEFAVAGRRIGAAEDATAASTGIFGGVFAIALAAAFFRSEAESSALAIGLCGGLLMSGVLFTPYLRRGARQSPGDFLAARLGGRAAPALTGMIVVASLLPMLVAEIAVAAMIGSWTLGITRPSFVVLATMLMLVPPLVGGMRAVTVAGVLQFVLFFAALAFASVWISQSASDNAFPLVGYVTAATSLQAAGILNGTVPSSTTWNFVGLGLCVTLGVAVAPVLLMRSAATRSAQAARGSIARALLVVALFSLACVSMAAVTKWTVEDNPRRLGSIAELVSEPWVVEWLARGETFVTLCGKSASEAGSFCPGGLVQPGDLAIDPQIALIAAPEIAGLPSLAAMLLAAGCLAAAISAGSLTLFGIGRALGHDLLFRAFAPRMPASRRLMAERLVLLVVAVAAADMAFAPPADYLRLVLVSLSLSASGLFPVLLMAVWWPRANRAGALAGMFCGFAIAAYLAATTIYAPTLITWLEPAGLAELARYLGAEKSPLLAVPAGLVVTVLVSLATRVPSDRERTFAAALLVPRDLPVDDDIE